jgi:hypothetical protein
MIAHFYHTWVDGEWERPAAAHVMAMGAAGLRPDVFAVGVVGSAERRKAARGWWRKAAVADSVEFTEADAGYEQVTLRRLREWVATADPATPVLYAHSKGAYNLSPITAVHRDAMTSGVVRRWRGAVAALTDHDVAGCFWSLGTQPHFTGNFWWARAGYLAGLPVVADTDRFAAELWLGQDDPAWCELGEFTYAEMCEAVLGRPELDAPGLVMPPGVSLLGSPAPAATIPYGRAERM